MMPEQDLAAILRPALLRTGVWEAARALQRDAENEGDEEGAFAFTPGLVVRRIVAALARRSTEVQARAFAAWTVRPEVVPFLALDRQTVEPDIEGRVESFFDGAPVLDPVRFDLVRQMLARTDALARGADLAIYTLVAAILADEDDLPEEEQTALDVVIPEMLGTRQTLMDGLRGEMEDVYMVLYADMPVAGIRAFLEAIEEPAAQWYYAHIGRAVGEALVQSFREASRLEENASGSRPDGEDGAA